MTQTTHNTVDGNFPLGRMRNCVQICWRADKDTKVIKSIFARNGKDKLCNSPPRAGKKVLSTLNVDIARLLVRGRKSKKGKRSGKIAGECCVGVSNTFRLVESHTLPSKQF